MRTRQIFRKARSRASALVATLSMIAILSLLIMVAVRLLRSDQSWVLTREGRLEALAWAETGLAIAGHPSVEPGDPLLEWRSPATGGGYSVEIMSEDALLNPNQLLLREDGSQFLREVLMFWGADLDEASAYVDALTDWIDADDEEMLNGAESGAYEKIGLPGLPPNRPLRNVAEMSQVMGGDLLERVNPRWQAAFSVRADGLLDLRDAAPDLIAVALAIPMERALRFADLRYGPDRMRDTEDDPQFQTVEDALMLVGQIGVPEEVAQARVTVNSQNLRITSTGIAGNIRRSIAAVVRGQAGGRRVIFWKAEVPSDTARNGFGAPLPE